MARKTPGSGRRSWKAVEWKAPGARMMLFDVLWAMGPSEHDGEMVDILSEKGMDESADALWRRGMACCCGRGLPEDKVRGRELMERAASLDKKYEGKPKSMRS